MIRVLFITLLLSGCVSTQNKPLTETNKNSLGKIGVVSSIGDTLQCNFTGLTVFTNEEQLYQLPRELNIQLTTSLTENLMELEHEAISLDRDVISYIKDTKGASKFSNIKLNKEKLNAESIDTVVIYDGDFHYKSTGGYYARNNALNTLASLYVYSVSSGELMGSFYKPRTDLRRYFSCQTSSIDVGTTMYKLAEKAGIETQKELVNSVFSSVNSI